MKRLLILAAALFAMSGVAKADEVYISTNVTVNQSKRLTTGRGLLGFVIVGATATASTIQLWDGTSSSQYYRYIGKFDTTGIREFEFHVPISSGIAYTTTSTGAGADLTILFRQAQ